jgi:hypothetical protein
VGTVVHCASASKGDAEATRNLVQAAAKAGSPHLVYISIVGADRVSWGYLKTKRDCEHLNPPATGRGGSSCPSSRADHGRTCRLVPTGCASSSHRRCSRRPASGVHADTQLHAIGNGGIDRSSTVVLSGSRSHQWWPLFTPAARTQPMGRRGLTGVAGRCA